MNLDNLDNSHNSFLWPDFFIDYLCERWIPCQASTSVLCLNYRPVTVHCSTKGAYTSEITFLAYNPWLWPSMLQRWYNARLTTIPLQALYLIWFNLYITCYVFLKGLSRKNERGYRLNPQNLKNWTIHIQGDIC